MLRDEVVSESPRRDSRRTVRRGSGAESIRAVHQRLASAEQELRIQFTRIAQLQAQVDLLLAALRRSPDGVHVQWTVSAESRHPPVVEIDGEKSGTAISVAQHDRQE